MISFSTMHHWRSRRMQILKRDMDPALNVRNLRTLTDTICGVDVRTVSNTFMFYTHLFLNKGLVFLDSTWPTQCRNFLLLILLRLRQQTPRVRRARLRMARTRMTRRYRPRHHRQKPLHLLHPLHPADPRQWPMFRNLRRCEEIDLKGLPNPLFSIVGFHGFWREPVEGYAQPKISPARYSEFGLSIPLPQYFLDLGGVWCGKTRNFPPLWHKFISPY